MYAYELVIASDTYVSVETTIAAAVNRLTRWRQDIGVLTAESDSSGDSVYFTITAQHPVNGGTARDAVDNLETITEVGAEYLNDQEAPNNGAGALARMESLTHVIECYEPVKLHTRRAYDQEQGEWIAGVVNEQSFLTDLQQTAEYICSCGRPLETYEDSKIHGEHPNRPLPAASADNPDQ